MIALNFLHGQTVLILSLIAAGLASPFLAALVTKAPTFLTGVITTLITTAAAFVTDWLANPNHFEWKTAASAALSSWALAFLVHKGWISDTTLQDRLHARGPQFGPPEHPARRAPRKAA